MSQAPAPVVIVLASGRGERFLASGGGVHKLQAPLSGKTVLEHTLQAVRASGLPWHLVSGGSAGMGVSIAMGVRATLQASGWLILPGDLPLIQPDTLLSVAAALPQHTVVVPVFRGQRGHPVGFGAGCRDDLLALKGDAGAASVVRQHGAHLLPLDDPGTVEDVDTPDDLARVEALMLHRQRSNGPA